MTHQTPNQVKSSTEWVCPVCDRPLDDGGWCPKRHWNDNNGEGHFVHVDVPDETVRGMG